MRMSSKLQRELARVAALQTPAVIVMRYREAIGRGNEQELPLGITMGEMYRQVIAAESGEPVGDTLSDKMAWLASA
jgi:hypothetical protein